MKSNRKIGIGIATCNRKDFFVKCVNSLPSVDRIIAVNDGLEYPSDAYSSKLNEVIQHKSNKGVGKTKNDCLRYLLAEGCTDIFLLEDDIYLKDESTCEKYIKASEVTGIQHLNFGYHGPLNLDKSGNPNPRKVVKYTDEISIALNLHCPGALSYYTRHVLTEVGILDEIFKNAWEHIDLTHRILNAGYHPPFWWFADLANSMDLIGDQDATLSHSVIRKNESKFKLIMRLNSIYYSLKHGRRAWKTPDTTEAEVSIILDKIKNSNREIAL